LNVRDMNADFDAATRAALTDLPRQVRKPPPPRVGKYVTRLIDHARQSQ
jgi:hypothetical protein